MIRIFAFQQYYPQGGVTDLIPKAFLDVDSAKEWVEGKVKDGSVWDYFSTDVHFHIVSDLVLTDILAYGYLDVPARGEPVFSWLSPEKAEDQMICAHKNETWWM